jgi:hypothetical protein
LPWYVHACNTFYPPLNNCSNEWGTGSWRVVAAPIWPAAFGAPFSDHMDGDTSRWDAIGLWHLTTGVGSNGTRAWIYNNGSTYNTGDPNGGFLTSPPIAIPAAGYFLRFRSWNDTEPGTIHWDQRYVQIAQDSGPYHTVLRMTDEETRLWGQAPALNLSAYAGHTIRVRFSFTTLDEFKNEYAGWAIDDFSIDATPSAACSDANEPNNTIEDAKFIAAGGGASGQICPGGDVDFFKFTAGAGDRVIIRLNNLTGLAPHLDILDSDGTSPLASADASSVGMLAPQAGTYFVKVRSRYHPSAGGTDQAYSIQIQSDADVPVVSFTYPAASGSYAAGGMVNLTASATDSGGVQKMDIYGHGPDWQTDEWVLLCTDTNGSDGWSCPLDTSTRTGGALFSFYAVATDWVGNQSAAAVWNISFTATATRPTVTLLPLASLSDATLIPLRWTAAGAPGAIDHFDIMINADGSGWTVWQSGLPATTTQINYFAQPGHAYAFRVVVYDQADNSAQAEASTTVATCGADSYEPDNSFDHATAIAMNASQQHTFCGVGDTDWFSFSALPGQTYWIRALPVSQLTSLWLTLFGMDGTTVLVDSPNPPDRFNVGSSFYWRAPSAGVYFLRTQHANSDVAGPGVTYRIQISLAFDDFLPFVMR